MGGLIIPIFVGDRNILGDNLTHQLERETNERTKKIIEEETIKRRANNHRRKNQTTRRKKWGEREQRRRAKGR